MKKNNRKKILIFGITGFIAANLIKKLKNFRVIGVSRSQIKSLEGVENIFEYDEIANIKSLEYIDFALDFSSRVSVEEFMNSPIPTFNENVGISLRHLSLLNEIGFNGHYIYVTSDRAIAPNDKNDYLNDAKIKNDPYGASKFFSELIIQYGLELSGVKKTVLRFPNLYGVNQKSAQLLPTILSKISAGELKISLNSFEGNRNYLHVEDATDAILKFLQSPLDANSLCISGENIEITYIIESIKKLFNKLTGKSLNFFEKKSANKRSLYLVPPPVLDDQIFRKTYNWQPQVSIQQGLLELLRDGVNNAK